MSLSIGRSILSGPNVDTFLARPYSRSNRLIQISESAVCGLSQRKNLSILSFSITTLLRASIHSYSLRAGRTYASFARNGSQKTSWDEAADSYFSEEREQETSPTSKPPGVKKWKSLANRERPGFGRRSDAYEGDGGNRQRQVFDRKSVAFERDGGSRQQQDFGRQSDAYEGDRGNRPRQDFGRRSGAYEGDRGNRQREDFGRRSDAYEGDGGNRERQSYGRNSDAYGGDRGGRTSQTRNSEPLDRQRTDVGRISGYGGERDRVEQWQGPAKGYRSRDPGVSSGRSGSDWQTRGKTQDTPWSKGYNRGQDERANYGDDRRWPAREYTPPLPVEGQAVYGVAPIISALQISRRTFYCLYMQENLLLSIGLGRRKDKAAVTAIEQMTRDMGVTVKEASKHDLNMLVDNRPHQGLVLDASPLELLPVESLDAPVYQESKPPPVWVALDEVTDPQNFGAILRSAYFLGAEGVVVCAKNSAPLSGVVSKASAGAMEVMEVLFCKNMMRFLDNCKGNGWRVVGASAECASMPVRQLPHGIATVLVLGNEGKGLRTNVRRSCNQLVSIASASNASQRPNYDFAGQDVEESELNADVDVDLNVDVDLEEEEDEESGRRGTESSLVSGPSAVDSLNRWMAGQSEAVNYLAKRGTI